ncbi:MAG: hypothetical protein PHC69_04165 [Ruminiclostridium sp.]|nr:hypothetical protein [Ruminiclostridium sp.]
MIYNKNIGEIAATVYNTYDFYKWFYSNKGYTLSDLIAGNVPILKKDDLFQYETIFKRKYFSDVITNITSEYILKTTGTSGMMLEVLQHTDNLHFISLLAEYSQYIEKTKGISFMLLGGSLNTPQPVQAIMNNIGEILRQSFVLIDTKCTIEELTATITNHNIQTILDISLELSRIIANDNCYVNTVKNIVFLAMENSLAQKLLLKGINLISLYGCAEFGFVGVSMPNLLETYFLFSKKTLGIISGDKYLRYGHGKLVGTVIDGPFPFINYCNNDIVTITEKNNNQPCDTLQIHGRDMAVHIPREAEATVDCYAIYSYLTKLPYSYAVLLIQYKIYVDSAECNILACCVETSCYEMGIAPDTVSSQVMSAGAGMADTNMFFYFPVIYVQKGLFSTIGRNKPFIDLSSGIKHEKWTAYNKITSFLIENGYNIIE